MSAQGIKSRIQDIQESYNRLGDALPEVEHAPPCLGCGNVALAAFPRPYGRARPGFGPGSPPGPLSPEAYKYPPWGLKKSRSRALVSFCNLVFRFIVVVLLLLLVVVLAIRVKERERERESV